MFKMCQSVDLHSKCSGWRLPMACDISCTLVPLWSLTKEQKWTQQKLFSSADASHRSPIHFHSQHSILLISGQYIWDSA